jgi:class 3 adenylate cyclase
MVLATYRRDEMHRKHPLAPIVQGWRRSGSAKVVELEPLDGPQISSMVRAIFDVDEVSAEFRDFLLERSEGNPFVLEEMLKEAMDSGDVYRSETGEWERKDLAQLAIPRSVSDNIMARVERMDPDHADVVRAAAVLGPTFQYEVLVALTGLSESTVQAALTSCVQQQLIVEVARAPGVYRFRHALTREAVYEDLILPTRQQLHARAAEVLKARAGTRPVDIENHLLAAGDYEHAIPLCLSAADEAMALVAYPEACALWERVLEHVTDDALRGRVLTSLGHAIAISSEPARAQRYLQEAVQLFESLGDRQSEAKARLWLGRTYWEQSQVVHAKEEYERARAILEEAGPSEELANAYVRLSSMGVFDLDSDEAIRWAEAAIATAEKAGADQPRVWAYNFLGVAKTYKGDVEEGLGYLDRSYQEAMDRGWIFIASNALHNILATCSEFLLMAKDMEPMLRKLDAIPATVWPVGPFRWGMNDLNLGKIDVAVEELEAAVLHARQQSLPTVAVWAEAGLAMGFIEQGRLEVARALIHPLIHTDERQELMQGALAVMQLYLAAGEPEDAEAAARIVQESGSWYLGQPLLARTCVEALIAVGALDEAGTVADAIEVRHEPSQRPYADAAQGAVALARGEAQRAQNLLSRAADAFRDAEYRTEDMHCRLGFAEALAALSEPDRAQAELESIIRLGTEVGARLLVGQARALANRLGLTLSVAEPIASSVSSIEEPELVETGERLVSILFADVRGYTAMTNERPPADMIDSIGSFHRWAQQEIDKRGGLVDKFAGDAVMATFNVSGRALDHAERALEAGMALQDKAAMMGLPVGVGIAVGAAIVGRFAEGANISVLGETTNLAARLQATAGAEEIALSEEAYRRTKSFLEQRSLTADPVTVELKGFDAPVNAYVVRRARAS